MLHETTAQENTHTPIACLGWGSLIWDPRSLLMLAPWHTDGPTIRVEFGRQSHDGRITLVLCEEASTVPALWAIMATTDPDEAINSLRDREGIPPADTARYIGHWSIGQTAPLQIPALAAWADAHGLRHVIWTHLPPRFMGEERQPTRDEVLTYLANLHGAERVAAERYVRQTPRQIRTTYRQAIEETLDWAAPEDGQL